MPFTGSPLSCRVLTLAVFVPGLIHALYIILKY
ncbi:hypothetical protein FOXG_16989 [Fusarium oxysporum f. sp. lycopersici 4287]|uniref:Plasma membrane proteolipid 3 n=2 Tax=Fusarium oxysporum TaxID=5507 RepID=A0A0J9W944_FUSO4|nr:uncharacterized protein FOXG_16989 [Fusarium oxysporum f. sp. lycopersici 4287]KNB19789.1 hypothetical protein FOXG_16989 [Fusarium oxysporum f. sp. lycopersici 4287]